MMPKILAPVRDRATFTAAANAGADAVYMGIGELNMRLHHRGIDLNQLPSIVTSAHDRGMEVYVVLNVIVYDHEVSRIDEIVREIKSAGADAIICWDFAVISACKKHAIPFHVSTQASISNSSAAKFYENLGAKCLVLARECTLEQIKEIKHNTSCTIEVFCHGAMCVSVSGRCFMSQFLNCTSANRGECAQPCRREYHITDKHTGAKLDIGDGYVMSPKDLCTLNILDQVVATGVDVLKIEGRARSPEYIATVTKVYKQALLAVEQKAFTDECKKDLMKELEKVYNRGFSTGFFLGRPAEDGWAHSANSVATEKKEFAGFVSNYFKKIHVAEITLKAGKLVDGNSVYIQGKKTGVERIEINGIRYHPDSTITFPCSLRIKSGDEVYRIVPNKS
ncbi:MAG: hypothetical protein A2V81_00870 [Candidatus Abawacabacteria bacterium RBG_16_42_10]|uniref:Peptidase family U32 C-terminal domain-containing protein n=1 Tax=Candidatus Abawacabacteria bacterium RBG_16_42_10 TaxID=1817814 RepID=A0A1F4XI97_9BACT|nr:MAG: hypothetical protein A2V81_00870 [Candidatus Abawacabacteria bacterium RBG_16_42_10]